MRRTRKKQHRITAVIAALGLLLAGGAAAFVNTSGSSALTAGGPNVGAAAPPVGGYFQITPAGTAFPTDQACADQVRQSTWEPRPENNAANHSTPPDGYLTGTNGDWDATWNSTYRTRVTGNFVGTTDQIIQWAACKWGWGDDLVRGEAIDESNWQMSSTGDSDSKQADCFTGYTAPCPTSFGFLQIKWYFNPSHTIAGNSMPYARDDTAFSIDYALSQLRGCYDGHSTFLNGGKTTGDLWNCIGSWFSGDWASSGSKSYQSRVQGFVNGHSWEGWADKGGGTTLPTPPTTKPATTTTKPVTTTTKAPTTTTKPVVTTTTLKPPPPTTTTTLPPPPPKKHHKKWYACVNRSGVLELRRQGTSRPSCAHVTDSIWTWDVVTP